MEPHNIGFALSQCCDHFPLVLKSADVKKTDGLSSEVMTPAAASLESSSRNQLPALPGRAILPEVPRVKPSFWQIHSY